MPTDTPEKLNYEKMGAIALYLLNLVQSCASAQFLESSPGYDPTPTELQYMNSVFSDLFRLHGIPEAKSRDDIDMVVIKLKGAYGL